MFVSMLSWWCCLAPPERGSIAFIMSNPWFSAGYVFKSSFDDYWLAAGAGFDLGRKAYFLRVFGMVEGVIVVGEDAEIPVYYLDVVKWAQMFAFSLTPEGACMDGCYLSNPGFPL